MINYIAGNEEGIPVYRWDFAVKHGLPQLWSYWKFHEGSVKTGILKMGNEPAVKLFLDSGAFSAFSQGAEIDIYEYIGFIKEHKELLEVYANLDVIGDPQATWDNQKIMEAAGLSPLPCFHYGEDWKWLDLLIKKYDYIALGGMVPITTRNLQPWLDDCFANHICDKSGMPKVKVHGFGMTSLRLLLRYPWFSVDSTSWVMTGRMGQIYVPCITRGEYDYTKESLKIAVSSKSPSKADKGKHFENLSKRVQQQVLTYVKEKGFQMGQSSFKTCPADYQLASNEKWAEKKGPARRLVEIIEEPGITNMYQQRDMLNIQYFQDLEKFFPKWPWRFALKARKGKAGFGL